MQAGGKYLIGNSPVAKNLLLQWVNLSEFREGLSKCLQLSRLLASPDPWQMDGR